MHFTHDALTRDTLACQQFLQTADASAGKCAIACAALWLKHAHSYNGQLSFGFSFHENVAHHVYLQDQYRIFDPTAKQFSDNALSIYTKHQHRFWYHQPSAWTNQYESMESTLTQLCWPPEQFPSREKVQVFLQEWKAQACRELLANSTG